MKYLITLFFLIFVLSGYTQKLNWLTWDEAVAANEKNPKLIFVDVYTDWCGWCKRMDANTFNHPDISKYLSDKYYVVKFNAEGNDTINFQGYTFVNQNPGKPRSTHQFAAALLDNQLAYPKFVIFNSNFERMSIIPGYYAPKDFEPIINYFGGSHQNNIGFEEYKKNFVGVIP